MSPDSNFICYVGLPYLSGKKIKQDLYIKAGRLKSIKANINCFDVSSPGDSIKVFNNTAHIRKKKKKGVFYTNLVLPTQGDHVKIHHLYEDILYKNSYLPSGSYCTYLSLKTKDTVIQTYFIQHVDSVLSVSSSTHKEFDQIYGTYSDKRFLGMSYRGTKKTGRHATVTRMNKSSRKAEKRFTKKGFGISYRENPDYVYTDLSFQNRYVGYYSLNKKEDSEDQVLRRKAKLNKSPAAGIDQNLENSKPVFEQVKGVRRGGKAKEVYGNISLAGYVSTGQEEYSENENNYYELAGQMEIPVMNIPIVFDGLYTSQDKGRLIKTSFVRLHYDSEHAKNELIQLISGYNRKYAETQSYGTGIKALYGNYLKVMAVEKDNLSKELMHDLDMPDLENQGVDTSGLMNSLANKIDKKFPDSLKHKREGKAGEYQAAALKYQRIQELEKKIQHYQTLLDEFDKNKYLDSALVYDRLKDIGDMDSKSYKQLSKSAEGLLPEHHQKKFITGLTSMDLGIFPKQLSAYTLNGQTIKGVDMNYDLGFCETGVTYGSVDYISRDGQLDRYTGYSGRVGFRPGAKQKTSIIYYGYMPGRKMLNETSFFKDVDVHMPAFKNPIDIVSVMHSGRVTRYVDMETEVATSFRTIDDLSRKDIGFHDRMAYRIDFDGMVPKTGVNLSAGYERVGKQFENNTLPLMLSGIQKYVAGAKSQFFRGFLIAGINYNYLIQENFSSKSANSKWGFELATVSKRYPTASVSYKPFSTFRSFSDTLGIPQRPIFGEVWLGKLSYQLKSRSSVLRVTVLYNKNTATADTLETKSNLKQLNAIYTRGKFNYILNAGQTELEADNLSPVHGKTNFLTVGLSCGITPQWTAQWGGDVGTNKSGLSRYGVNLGLGYRLKKVPLMFRTNFRYNAYKMTEALEWKRIYSGMLSLNWQFRLKIKDQTS